MIVFHDSITDMFSNKKLQPIVTELFIRSKKINISVVFITQFYFPIPKNIRLNSTYYLLMKISDKRELQWFIINNSSDIHLKNFMKFDKVCTEKPFYFQSMILLLHQIIFYIFGVCSFRKNIKSNHDNCWKGWRWKTAMWYS